MRVIREKKIYQMTFLPRVFPVNCYFVEEEEDLTLVDTGLPYGAKPILQAAKQIGKQINRIVLTHAHDDHVGALDSLKQELPHVQVFISKRDARLLAGDRALEAGEPNIPIRGGVPKNIKTKPDIVVEDGDRIMSLLAVSTPGHTPGSMSFLDTRNDSIIAGDALQTRGGIAVSGQFKPLFPFPAWATWNKELALESAGKIAAFQPTLLCVGHGRMLKNPEHLLKQAINKAKNELTLNE